jgi:hypothetical protein
VSTWTPFANRLSLFTSLDFRLLMAL